MLENNLLWIYFWVNRNSLLRNYLNCTIGTAAYGYLRGWSFYCEGLLRNVCRYHWNENYVSPGRPYVELTCIPDDGCCKTYAELVHNICYSFRWKKIHKLASSQTRKSSMNKTNPSRSIQQSEKHLKWNKRAERMQRVHQLIIFKMRY